MKQITALMAATLFLGTIAEAQIRGPQRGRGDIDLPSGPNGSGQAFLRLFESDTNGDGRVSQEELPSDQRGLIEDYDTDGDGAISRSEARLIAPANAIDRSRSRRGQRGQGHSSRLGSGRSSGGFGGATGRGGVPGRSGGGGSGFGPPLDCYAKGSQVGGVIFLIFDTNGDGELSAREIRNASQALMKLDRDANERLTRREIGAVRSSVAGGPSQGGSR